ncbi:MAG: CPBP family intramembrane metalloprotease [Theionarchaea archaeon]|nr:CPBP family intramembrane metalloprotease [Theionarchaea archaeon]MBU7000352.1 CPBP family intramembrane metalloprotease [Theionarchaea archaeon]MBU7040426.1 CPBP family intramembrane metalloprotease [Theionarchaea archaeon]
MNDKESPGEWLRRKRILIAWISMLVTSNLAVIIWREVSSGEPSWWPWIHAVGLLVLCAFTFIDKDLKPLRAFVGVLLTIFVLGFGGGWKWGIIPFIRGTSAWTTWETQAPWAVSAVVTHLVRLSPALVILAGLLLTGRRLPDLFLVKGTLDAPVEPSRLLGMKKPEPWTRTGSIFAVVFTVVTFIFLVLSTRPTANAFMTVLPLIPVAVFIAAINAFNEEFTLRAAPLSVLVSALGSQQALVITTVYFGLGHYYGVPNGVLGVLLSGFLGWFLGKSLLETRGFFWAWLIHFLPDVVIFTFYAMNV